MRKLLVAPIALLTAACTDRPTTPSGYAEDWSDQGAPPQIVALPSQGEAIARWQLPPTNVWARYEKYTLMSALDAVPRTAPLPDVTQLEVVQRATSAAARVASAGLPNDTMWVLDMRGAASVAFGAELSRASREPVALVPTFNNWPAENEMIPAEETLSALIAFSPRPTDPGATSTRPVFLLDAWRLAYRDDEPPDDVTDNRYILNPSELPDPAMLRAQGIRRVAYVVESLSDTTNEEDDLNPIFAAYEAAGIELYMLDLDVLLQPVAMQYDQPVVGYYYWGVWFGPRYYFACGRRWTILDDPRFYTRAHGGFGGIHSGPSPFHSAGMSFGGHYGGGG
jgi:hypothetical protein